MAAILDFVKMLKVISLATKLIYVYYICATCFNNKSLQE